MAMTGRKADGHDFIPEALSRGAAAVVAQKSVALPVPEISGHATRKGLEDRPAALDVVWIEVENTRKALAEIAARFYHQPSEKMFLAGITGTNGKTTTAFLLESILNRAGFNTGVIGTINYRFAGRTFDNPMTTPESLDLQRILAEMKQAGVTHVVMEVSSHALDLFRIHECRIDVGVFTNLTRDHLDYHEDMNTYWDCKKRLFTEILTSGPKKDRTRAVVNCGNARGKELFSTLKTPCLSVGRGPECMVRPGRTTSGLEGVSGRIETPSGPFDFKSPLVGIHNIENILCAAGVGLLLNLPVQTIRDGIEAVGFVPGRLEKVPGNSGRFVFVDYAHTPDALKNVLTSLRPLTRGALICIFGCGGDRDRGKRPQMGRMAGDYSDFIVVTSDNPRTEDPGEIIRQILPGLKQAGLNAAAARNIRGGFQPNTYVVEPDREKAIQLGITVSGPDDVVLIAGKGHETYQIIGKTTIPFDDKKIAGRVLDGLDGGL